MSLYASTFRRAAPRRRVQQRHDAAVSVELIFETHSISVENERGIASGWNDCPLSEEGRLLAAEMRDRHSDSSLAAVYCSDLRRAVETAEIAFADLGVPIRQDSRLG